MKTKFYWVALLASAALIAQAKAGGHNGGGGGGGFAAPHVGGGAHVGSPAFYSSPRGNFGGGRFMAPGPHFSSYRTPMAFRQQRVGSFDRGFARSHQFATETANRRFDAPRTLNHRDSRLTRNGNNSGNRFENRGSNTARAHVFAQRSADWHRDWDRHHDHWWHGHRCRFVDGSWFIYDIGFDLYDYWYPYEAYAYAYNPYDYNAGVYEGGGADYYDQGAYDSFDQSADSTVAAVQEQLARQGYYRGELDGVFGPETRRAIIRYQSDHGLGVTGRLNMDTLHALGAATSGE
ncbi:MAG: peptidoglycan-binding domain-containing protein [Chthoniobacterales bacterium]